jgi:hypothetical protein
MLIFSISEKLKRKQKKSANVWKRKPLSNWQNKKRRSKQICSFCFTATLLIHFKIDQQKKKEEESRRERVGQKVSAGQCTKSFEQTATAAIGQRGAKRWK